MILTLTQQIHLKNQVVINNDLFENREVQDLQ